MDGQLLELNSQLVGFLRDKNPAVRQIALENLVGHTTSESPHRSALFLRGLPKEPDAVRDIKILCRDQVATAHDAFRALVNLSDEPLLNPFLSDKTFIAFIVSYIIDPRAICADLACMLLANLSASAAVSSLLTTLTIPMAAGANPEDGQLATLARCGSCVAPSPRLNTESRDVLALPLLIEAFVDGARPRSAGSGRKGNLHFLASVFANISATSPGRAILFTPVKAEPESENGKLEYPLAKIVVFTEHEDLIRRGGVVSTIKNCAFQHSAHPALLAAETDAVAIQPGDPTAAGIDVLPRILLPLAGPEEFDLEDMEKLHPALQMLPADKKREPDSALRLLLVEALLLLCTTRGGRDTLRAAGTYEIVRTVHLEEQTEKVSEHIERLVNLLQGAEEAVVGTADDADDGDDKIEEV